MNVMMPFLIPGSRRSMVLRASPINVPASPPQSGCESVTPRSQAYLDTPPVLDTAIFDTVPFSASFSAFLDFTPPHDTPQSLADTAPDPAKDVKRLSSRAEASYYVELTNIRDVDSEWEDDEVEEVMIISPKPKKKTFPALVAHALPTPPFSPPAEPILDPSPSVAPQESYTILRTLHRTQTSHLSLAVSSGCAPSAKKAVLRHALYAIRTYRLPLSRAALAERAALEVLSMRNLGENPYVQRAPRFWDDGQTLFIVLEHCGGGNLLGLIQAEGPVDDVRMKRWACEIASGIAFVHNAGIIHNDIRPSTVLFRVNGHVCIGGFEHATVIAARQKAAPSIEERQRGLRASAREWCEAPEVLFGWEIGLEVDCWAFGVVLIWMITGKHPWYQNTVECPDMIRNHISNGLLPVCPLEAIDTAAEHLIRKCLDRNPSRRPTIEQIKAFEWFADINWDNISLARVPDIPITLPTPDLTPDVPADMPSTIIAPDLSLSTLNTEMEIEWSLPWTPARISRPIRLASPGATTIASGHSAVLSHGDMAPLVAGRLRNPSPPLPPSSTEKGDTSALPSQQPQEEEQLHQSFLPQLSEVDGALRVGLGVCVDEFGTFLSEREHEWEEEDEDSGGSPEISLQGALALPIPLLVTPRPSESDLRATPGPGLTRPRLPFHLLRWRSSTGAGAERDEAASPHAEREPDVPELSWHGIDADPFRCSPPPSVPTKEREAGSEGPASSPRVDATFRWSNASLEMGGVMPDVHDQTHAHTQPSTGLTALTRRICEQGRALLRKSRSNVHLRLAGPTSPTPPLPPLHLGTAAAIEGGFGSVQRIGLGIGYSLPSRYSSPRPSQPARAACAPAQARRYEAQKDAEEAALVGCYAGLGGGRWGKKNAQRDASRLEPSPCGSGSVLILGSPGLGGAVVPAPTGNA